MTMKQRIERDFGYNDPIIQKDLEYDDMSSAAIRNALKRLVDQGVLVRYDKGIYYRAKELRFGLQTKPQANEVLRKRYISSDKGVYGYYGGLKLLNEVGLTTQVPSTVEIVSNKAFTNKRSTSVGSNKVVIRKPVVSVSKETLPFLKMIELLSFDQFTSLDENDKRVVLKKIGANIGIIKQLTSFADKLSPTVSKKILQSGVINALTS